MPTNSPSPAGPKSMRTAGAPALAWAVALCAGLATAPALIARSQSPAPGNPAEQPPKDPKDKDKPKPAPAARPPVVKPPTPTPVAPTTPPSTSPPKAPATKPSGAAAPGSAPVTAPPASSPPPPPPPPAATTPAGQTGPAVGGKGVTTLIPGSPEPLADGTIPPPPSAPEPLPGLVLEGNAYRFSRFAEPVELNLIVELIIQESKIEVVTTDAALAAMKKKVDFGSPLTIPKDKLLSFLSTIVESQGAALSRDPIGYYTITLASEAKGLLGTDEFSTTRIIPTRGLRPTALSSLINTALLGGTPAPGGGPAVGVTAGGQGGGRISFLDDLGLILMNDTPRRIDTVETLVDKLIEEQGKQAISHFDILHISAAVAKQRLLELLGSRSGRPGANPVEQQQQAALAAATGNPGASGSLSNIADRLTPDPQSNSLVFRGRDDEKEFISKLLREIDRPSQLKGKWYPLGSASAQLAQMGRRQQLGEIVSFESANSGGRQGNGRTDLATASPAFVANQVNQQQGQENGGPMFVIDPEGRGFMYFGTPEQQLAVEEIARQFSELLKNEEIILEFYKLKHSKSYEVADLMNAIIGGQVAGASGRSGSLLPGSSNSRSSARSGSGSRRGNADGTDQNNRLNRNNDRAFRSPALGANSGNNQQGTGRDRNNDIAALGGDGGELFALTATDDIIVTADEPNNTIVVKAPKKLQIQFKKLIDKLDLRRPQVYIDAKIVAITASDSFRLAFETQLINANGTGGVFNTNFGIGSLPGTTASPQPLLNSKTVGGALGGITAAIIKSDQIPLVLTALANNVDTQILATPQILVDDNESALVESLDSRPTTTQSQSGSAGTTLTGFNGFESAGPSLSVTPQISEGNYLKLDYEIVLSSFQGDSQVIGGTVIPPARLENTVQSSATVPSDSTIVVGGLDFVQTNRTVVKVPFLGDIPILGQLFRDEQKSNVNRRLYIFITPKIMRSPTFDDLRLLTMGPDALLKDGESANLPPPEADRMIVVPPAR